MVKPEKVETAPTLGQAGDTGLVEMQTQPDSSQHLRRPLPGRFGPGLGRADHHEVVAIADEHAKTVTGTGEVLVEHVERDIAQQRRDDSPNAIANFEFEVALAYRRGERIWGSRKYRSTTKRDAKGSI